MATRNRNGVKTIKRKNEIKPSDPNFHKYYNSSIWKSLRDWYYKQHPICEVCEAHGRVNPTQHIHHKFPFGNGKTEELKWALLTDANNLIGLCRKCHYAIHNKIDREHLIYGCYELTEEEYNKVHGL